VAEEESRVGEKLAVGGVEEEEEEEGRVEGGWG